MRVYLSSSAEAIALENPLAVGERVRWFIRRPSDVQQSYSGDLAQRLGVDPSMISDATFAIEDHDGFFPYADDNDASWVEGTVVSWVPEGATGPWLRGHVLVDLAVISLTPHDSMS